MGHASKAKAASLGCQAMLEVAYSAMRAAARADCAEQSAQRTFGSNSANWIQPSCKCEIALTATISISTKASQPRPLSRAAEYRHPSLADAIQTPAGGRGRLERVLPLCPVCFGPWRHLANKRLFYVNICTKTPGVLPMFSSTTYVMLASVLHR